MCTALLNSVNKCLIKVVETHYLSLRSKKIKYELITTKRKKRNQTAEFPHDSDMCLDKWVREWVCVRVCKYMLWCLSQVWYYPRGLCGRSSARRPWRFSVSWAWARTCWPPGSSRRSVLCPQYSGEGWQGSSMGTHTQNVNTLAGVIYRYPHTECKHTGRGHLWVPTHRM